MSRRGSEGEDIIGKWSEEKLDLLAQYLKAYSTIMNNQKTDNNPLGRAWLESYYYIDAFAGSVRPRSQDEERYIDGSPIRALRTEPRFDHYWFIDLSPKRIERVTNLRNDFPDCNIDIRQGNCNDVLLNEIIPHFSRSRPKRAFVFLDPYGLQVDWETVRGLAKTEACDIFVNFSVMGVTRLLPRDQSPEPRVIKQLNQVMGCTNWIEQIYQEPPTVQLDIFAVSPESRVSREAIRAEWLASLYEEQLQKLFPYVSRSVLMKNSTNSALYALCLASHNKKAVKITNEIFNRHEKLTRFR
jgi:three-Cys-motif partner protein